MLEASNPQLAIMNLRFTLIFLLFLGCFVNLASTTTRRSLLGRARDFLSKIASKLNKFLTNPRETIFDIVSGFTDNLTRSLSQVRHCYDATFGFHKLNIFNASLSFSSIALSFYEAFPNKTISRKSLRELKNSIQEIIGQCLTTPRRLTARYGFTEFSDWTPKEMKMLMGLKHTKKTAKRRHHHQKRSISYCELDETAPLPFRFDWRDFDKVTPVRHQGRCGSCWTFAVNAALESGWLIKRRLMASNTSIDLSEQHLLNCALGEMGEPRGTGCSGASSDIAFRFTLKKGSV